MAAIARMTFSFFVSEMLCIFIRLSLKFSLKGLIDNKSAVVQVMAWHQTGENLIPELIMTQFTDAYMWH